MNYKLRDRVKLRKIFSSLYTRRRIAATNLQWNAVILYFTSLSATSWFMRFLFQRVFMGHFRVRLLLLQCAYVLNTTHTDVLHLHIDSICIHILAYNAWEYRWFTHIPVAKVQHRKRTTIRLQNLQPEQEFLFCRFALLSAIRLGICGCESKKKRKWCVDTKRDNMR